MTLLVVFELMLVAVVCAGWIAAVVLLKRYRRHAQSPEQGGTPDPDASSERLTDTVGFVGGAYGILLGLLVVFAIGHFVDARQVTKDEAATAAALFTAVSPYPAENRDPLRHDLLCYMNAVATEDWEAARTGDLTGSENTDAYAKAAQLKIEALPQDEDVEASNHYFVTEEFLDLTKYRQLRLLNTLPEIPAVVWVVLYLSAFLFVCLTVFHLGSRRWLAGLAVTATTLLLGAIIAALIQLDAPYIGLGTSLRPVALEATIERIRDTNPEPASLWAPCDPLAADAAN